MTRASARETGRITATTERKRGSPSRDDHLSRRDHDRAPLPGRNLALHPVPQGREGRRLMFWLIYSAIFAPVAFLYVATALGGMPTLRRRGRVHDQES